jgi:hypothetical protein
VQILGELPYSLNSNKSANVAQLMLRDRTEVFFMRMQYVAITTAVVLGLAGPAVASQATGGAATTASSGARSTSANGRPSPSRESALAALQDARGTLSRLTEESMSHNVRDAYDRLSTDFRALYKSYTGHEVDERESAFTAGSHARPADWRTTYNAVFSSLAGMIGPEAARSETPRTTPSSGTGQPTATGTAAHNPGLTSEMTQSVRDDLLALRGQLERFENAAGTGGSPSVKR